MRRYKLGWKPSGYSKKDYRWSNKPSAVALSSKVFSVSDNFSFEHFIPWIWDQDNGDCGPHAALLGHALRDVLKGDLPRKYSRRFLYYWARRAKGFLNTYRDSGVYPRLMFDKLRKIGVPKEKFWPYSKSISKRPDTRATRKASKFRLGEYWLAESNKDIQTAMLSDRPVCVGLHLDNAFFGLRSTDVWERTGSIVGGHYMLIVGWRTNKNGELEWRLANSWGRGFCDNGFCWITDNAMQSGSDKYIIRGWE